MLYLYQPLILFIFLTSSVLGELISTFYGEVNIEEPVLIDLFNSNAFQRLKSIHQYGVSYYTTHKEEYTRFDHSLGVWHILREKGSSLEEQIAGALHDISHTAFSHVGDWVFPQESYDESYQDVIFEKYLEISGIEKILNKYGYTKEQINPRTNGFNMLEQALPNLCADRIDYNIQGAYFQKFLTKKEAIDLFKDLIFIDGKWVIRKKELATKLMLFSIFMTKDCWGNPGNYFASLFLSEAIKRGVETDLISWNEFHLGIDDDIWYKLQNSKDSLVKEKLPMIYQPNQYFYLTNSSDAEFFVPFKCRAINPYILESDGVVVLLTSISPTIEKLYQSICEQARVGWPIRFLQHSASFLLKGSGQKSIKTPLQNFVEVEHLAQEKIEINPEEIISKKVTPSKFKGVR